MIDTLSCIPFDFQKRTSYKATGGGRVVQWSWENFQGRGVLLVWIRVGQGPIALAVGAGGGCLDIFTLIYPFPFLSLIFGRRPDID